VRGDYNERLPNSTMPIGWNFHFSAERLKIGKKRQIRRVRSLRFWPKSGDESPHSKRRRLASILRTSMGCVAHLARGWCVANTPRFYEKTLARAFCVGRMTGIITLSGYSVLRGGRKGRLLRSLEAASRRQNFRWPFQSRLRQRGSPDSVSSVLGVSPVWL
jgi:hypothetical protein